MPMDENSLNTLLQSHVSTVSGGRLFTLAAGDLGSTAVQALIEKFFPAEDTGGESSLAISTATGPTTSDPLAVTGKIASLFGVPQELDVTAEFRVEDGDGQLRLTVQLPATWKFSTGFFAPIAAGDDGSFLFDGLTIESAQLILDSKGDAIAGLSQGVNYRGTSAGSRAAGDGRLDLGRRRNR